MLTVYGFPNSRATRVTWALEEIGADYDYRKVDIGGGEARKPPFSTLNPAGKVPVLADGDLIVPESAAILLYLGDKFPESGFTPPAGSAERALCESRCFFVIGELEQPLWTIAKHSFVLPEDRRVPAIKETSRFEFARAAEVLDTLLSDAEFMVGARFTAADILVAHTLGWARSAKAPLGSDRLEAYADRMLNRPARARARKREAAA